MDPNKITIRDAVDTGEAHATLKADIQQNGFKEPIRIDASGEPITVDGSQRTAIARELGVKIPVIVNKGVVEGLKTIEDVYKQSTTERLAMESKIIAEKQAKVIEKPQTINDRQFTSRVYKRLQEEYPQLKGDLPVDAITLKADARKAVELIAKDKEQAYRIAMNIETSPDVTSTAVNIAMTEKALRDGNNTLASTLIKNRSLAQTRRGQEIVSERGSVNDNSTSRYVKELISSRLDKLGKKYLNGIEDMTKKYTPKEKAMKALDKEVEKVKGKIKNKSMDMKEAQSLIDSLACN
jgi:hypothetical protein